MPCRCVGEVYVTTTLLADVMAPKPPREEAEPSPHMPGCQAHWVPRCSAGPDSGDEAAQEPQDGARLRQQRRRAVGLAVQVRPLLLPSTVVTTRWRASFVLQRSYQTLLEAKQ